MSNQDGEDTPDMTVSQQNIMSMRSSSSRRGSVFDSLKRFPSILNERRRSFLGVASSRDALGGSRSSAASIAVGGKSKSTHTGATFNNAALAVTFGAETYEHKVDRPKPVVIPDFVPIAGITVAEELKQSSSKCRVVSAVFFLVLFCFIMPLALCAILFVLVGTIGK